MLLLLACTGPVALEADPAASWLDEGRAALEREGVEELRLGVHPVLGEIGTEQRWKPVFAELERLMGVPVVPVEVESYGTLQYLLVEGTLDGGMLSAYDFVCADEVLPLHVAATPIVSGSLSYHAYVVALADQPVRRIRGLVDLEGAPIGYLSDRSASGWAYPAAMLLDAGMDPIRGARFLGGHHEVVSAVEEGSVLAGAVYSGVFEGAPLSVVAKSAPIPYDAWVLRGDLPVEAAMALGEALASIDTRTGQGRELLEPLHGINGFVVVDDSHYDGVREVRETLTAAGL